MPYTISSNVDFTGGAGCIINFTNICIHRFVTFAGGDLISTINGVNGNILAPIAIGTLNQVLTSNGTYPVWATPIIPTTNTGVFLQKCNAQAFGTGTNINVADWSANGTVAAGYDNLSGMDLTTGVFTCATTGKYDVWAQVEWTNNANSGARTLEIIVNGATTTGGAATTVARKVTQTTPNQGINAFSMETLATPYLGNVGDRIWVAATQNSGASLDISAGVNTRLRIIKLS